MNRSSGPLKGCEEPVPIEFRSHCEVLECGPLHPHQEFGKIQKHERIDPEWYLTSSQPFGSSSNSTRSLTT